MNNTKINKNMRYAGVGSRKTPKNICNIFTVLAKFLGERDYTLHSGGAFGADTAFEFGAWSWKRLIIVPSLSYNLDRLPKNIRAKDTELLIGNNEAAERIAELSYSTYNHNRQFPGINWNLMSSFTKKLLSRNAHQILGPMAGEEKWSKMVDFVICWTLNGNPLAGGTAMAIHIAEMRKIPVYNFGNEEHINNFFNDFKQFDKEEVYNIARLL